MAYATPALTLLGRTSSLVMGSPVNTHFRDNVPPGGQDCSFIATCPFDIALSTEW